MICSQLENKGIYVINKDPYIIYLKVNTANSEGCGDLISVYVFSIIYKHWLSCVQPVDVL